MKQKICLAVLLAMLIVAENASAQGHFHTSDSQGNFKVNYQASGGHYLTEDRSFDGQHLLGNYAYKSRDGESVGVAYGSDGAGFVISAPGYLSGSSSGAGRTQGASPSRGSSSGGSSVSSGQHQQAADTAGSHFRYQQDAASSSAQPTFSQVEFGTSVVTSHSSIPAAESPSFSQHHQLQQQQQQHDFGQTFSVLAQPTPQPLLIPSQPASSQRNIHDDLVASSINTQSSLPLPAPQLTDFQTTHTQLQSGSGFQTQPSFTQHQQPQQFSYQQPFGSFQNNPLLDQLVAALRAQQMATAPLVSSFPAAPPAAQPAPLPAQLPILPVPSHFTAAAAPSPNLFYLVNRPAANLMSYAFSSPGTDAIPVQFRFNTNPLFI